MNEIEVQLLESKLRKCSIINSRNGECPFFIFDFVLVSGVPKYVRS